MLDTLSVAELKRGFRVEGEDPPRSYHCIECGARFEAGEVYAHEGRFFEAARAVELHLRSQHPHRQRALIRRDTKYNTLTDHQQTLCELFFDGHSDKEIANRLGVSASTVRHQRFSFREKAKQAKLYLAIYECVFETPQREEAAIVPIHDQARMVDERYVTTQQEREHILQTAFTSLQPLRLKTFSPKEKKKLVVLARIAEELQPGRQYSERELNAILKEIFADFATLRRYLIEYGFMQRTKDGAKYWLT